MGRALLCMINMKLIYSMSKQIPFLDLGKINAPYTEQFSSIQKRILEKGWFLLGEYTQRFEEKFAKYCGTKHCIGVANGLDALTLSLMAKKIQEKWQEKDEVLVPAHTFIATAQAVLRAGLTPVFVDVTLEDYLIDYQRIESQITSRTRAIIPVHLYGKIGNISPLLSLAHHHNLFVLEDAAQAHGALLTSQTQTFKAGNLGEAAAFSFYPGKNLGALGDGGCVTTNDDELAKLIRILANYGAEEKYHHVYSGMNSRLDELQAAFLHQKLFNLDSENEYRRKIAKRYFDSIRTSAITLPYQGNWNRASSSVFHIFPIFSDNRKLLQSFLLEKGISTLIHYPIPLPQQQSLKEYVRKEEEFPHAEQIAKTVLSLPISPVMTEEEVDYIITTLNDFG